MSSLYYTPPTDEVFEEIKHMSIEIWNTYDDTYGYATEKISRIRDLKNIQDNAMYIVAMFDLSNLFELSALLSDKANDFIRSRLDCYEVN